MKTILRRITGSIMIIAAIVSLLVSVVFLVGIWRLRQPVTARFVENLDLLYVTTVTMEDSLVLVENTVASLIEASETISQSSTAIADTINGTSVMADSFAKLLGDESNHYHHQHTDSHHICSIQRGCDRQCSNWTGINPIIRH